jgi:hypothetical protein
MPRQNPKKFRRKTAFNLKVKMSKREKKRRMGER